MRVTAADHADPRVLGEFHELYTTAYQFDLPGEPLPPPATSARWITPTDEADVLTWFARDPGRRLLGAAWLESPQYDNTGVAHVDVRVHPVARRRGVGSALLGVAARTAVRSGRTVLSAYARQGGPGAAFAVASGLSVAHRAGRRVLPTVEIDLSTVDALAAGREADTRGVGLVRWTGRCPDRLVDGYAAALLGMHDAPTGDFVVRAPSRTRERIRRVEAGTRRRGVHTHVAAVRDDASGALAGVTEIMVHPDSPRAWQGTTVVLAPWRGRGFGLWLKAALIAHLVRAAPHVDRFETFNAVDNRHMVAVNDRLGYRLVDVWCAWQRPLTPAG